MFSTLFKSGLSILLTATLVSAAVLGQETPAPAAGDAAAIANADPAALAAVVEKLSPESRKAFAEMLAADWKDRPEWANMMIPLLKGEPLNLGVGWFQRGDVKYHWKWLSGKLDANQDGFIGRDELPKELPYPELFFSRLDRDSDGQLLPADFDHFIRQQPTPPQMLSRFLSAVLDADSNGRITPEELSNWLKNADKDKTGFLTVEDLLEDFSRGLADLNSGGDDMPPPDEMLSMFFRGELGAWGPGPKLGDEAPDFTLPTHDGKQTITLSKSRGKPVILIFGSFT